MPEGLQTRNYASLAALAVVATQFSNAWGAAWSKSLFAAMNGFRHATDPSNGLYSPRVNAYASVDHDFGVGLELEGVVGTRWTLYQVEHGVAARRYAAVGWFGPVSDQICIIESQYLQPWTGASN